MSYDDSIRSLRIAMSEISHLREERNFWREECRKRAEWINSNWSQDGGDEEGNYCPGCGLGADYIREYGHAVDGCPIVPLMQMPEEPKYEHQRSSRREDDVMATNKDSRMESKAMGDTGYRLMENELSNQIIHAAHTLISQCVEGAESSNPDGAIQDAGIEALLRIITAWRAHGDDLTITRLRHKLHEQLEGLDQQSVRPGA